MTNTLLKSEIIRRFGSQIKFAEAVGTNELAVSNVIHGRKRLSENEKAVWVEVLNMPTETLFIE